jgi:hypothetical protein
MRALVLALALAGCAAHHAAPPLTAPAPETGKVLVVAKGAPSVGSAQPIAVAITNGTDEALLEKGFSATGYVYFPAGTYRTLEVLLAEASGAARSEQVAIGEAP